MARLLRTWPLLALALLTLWVPWAQAQPATARIEQLHIAIWPEYDRPGVLVVYRFRLASDTQLPAMVTLPIPASVGEPTAVAWQGPDGRLLVARSTHWVEGDRALVSVEMKSLNGQLEFYDDLNVLEQARSYSFSWPGGVELGALAFEVQQPLGAGNLVLSPPADRRVRGSDGMTYAWIDHGPQSAAATPIVTLKYDKATPGLSVGERQAAVPADPVPPPPLPVASDDDASALPWLLGGLAVVLLAFGAGRYLWPAGDSEKPAADASDGPPPAPRETKGGPAAFCSNCGAKLDAGGKFCASCGAQLRNG
jgi:hypothetical protein